MSDKHRQRINMRNLTEFFRLNWVFHSFEMSESFRSQRSWSLGYQKSMKPIASLTKTKENDMENARKGNIEPIVQTWKSIMIPYAINSSRQDVFLFAAQTIHQLLFFKVVQQQQYDMAFPSNSEISVQPYVVCYVWCTPKAHFSIIILYFFIQVEVRSQLKSVRNHVLHRRWDKTIRMVHRVHNRVVLIGSFAVIWVKFDQLIMLSILLCLWTYCCNE